MAHSDTLIFLTNISWVFFLFLVCYFFFVFFFLPTFYKKVRARALVRNNQQRVVLVLLANSVVGSLLFLCELTKTYFLTLSRLLNTLVSLSGQHKSVFAISESVKAESSVVAGNKVIVSSKGFYLSEPARLVSFFDKFNK